eukprot:m.152478 g.152478  ORF g.152478 m.152478 type:complete len:1280 (+) comp24548_c0_seq3:74-3913(+)
MDPPPQVPLRVQSYKEIKKDQAKLEHDLEVSISKCITNAEKPPKDKHVLNIIKTTWKARSCEAFWARIMRLHHFEDSPVMIWKGLGVIHRLLHDGFPAVLQECLQLHKDYINSLGSKASRSLHAYSKLCALMAQFLVLKLEFHDKYPGFAGNLQDEVSMPDFSTDDLLKLLDSFLELQQMILMLGLVSFSVVKGLTSEASIECVVTPLATVIAESVYIYDKVTDMLYMLHEKTDSSTLESRRRRFEDQHAKLRQLYSDVRDHTQLRLLVDAPKLPATPPVFSSPRKDASPRGSIRPDAFSMFGPLPTSFAMSDPREQLLKTLRAEVDELNQVIEDDKGIIASLKSYIDSLKQDQHEEVDPQAVASLQQQALDEGNSKFHSALKLYSDMRQKHVELLEELQRARQFESHDSNNFEEALILALKQLDDLQNQLADCYTQKELDAGTIASLNAIHSDTSAQLELAQEELARAQVAQQVLQEKSVELSAQIEAKQTALSEAEKMYEEENAKLKSLQDQMEKEQQVWATMEGTYADLQDELEQSLKLAQEKITQTEQDRDELQKQLADKANSLEQREQEIQQASSQAESLQAQLTEANNKLLAQMKETSEKSQEISTLTTNAENQISQMETLKKELETQKAATAKMELRAQKTEELCQQQLDVAKEKISALKADLVSNSEQLLAQIQEGMTTNDQVTALHKDLSTARETIITMETTNEDLTAKVKSLSEEVSERDVTIAALETSLEQESASSKAKESSLRDQISAVEAQLADAKLTQEQISQATQEAYSKLQTEVDRVNALLLQKEQEHQQTRTELARAHTTLEELRVEMSNKAAVAQQTIEKSKQSLRTAASEAEENRKAAEIKHKTNLTTERRSLLAQVVTDAKKLVTETEHDMSVTASNFGAEFLVEEVEHAKQKLAGLVQLLHGPVGEEKLSSSNSSGPTHLGLALRNTLRGVCGLAKAENTHLNDAQGQAEKLRTLASNCLVKISGFLSAPSTEETALQEVDSLSQQVLGVLADTNKLVESISIETSRRSNVLEDEMHQAAKTVDDATKRIEEMMERAKAEMSQDKVAVHDTILETSMTLMHLIQQLIKVATTVQQEIVAKETKNKGTTSVSQFYKRHSRWVEGLLSAAKSVGAGATALVETADAVVQGTGKFEALMVCGHEIAASTAQLVSASRVKADPKSENKQQLEKVSKQVSEATKSLIESARVGGQKARKAKSAKEFLNLSVTQAKRLEMDSQIRVLELESSLNQERERLGQLRRAHYHLAELSDDDDDENTEC